MSLSWMPSMGSPCTPCPRHCPSATSSPPHLTSHHCPTPAPRHPRHCGGVGGREHKAPHSQERQREGGLLPAGFRHRQRGHRQVSRGPISAGALRLGVCRSTGRCARGQGQEAGMGGCFLHLSSLEETPARPKEHGRVGLSPSVRVD